MECHYCLAQQLSYLRKKGVLIIGSGNIIHNLRMLRVGEGAFNPAYGYDWAMEQNKLFKTKIETRDHLALQHIERFDNNIYKERGYQIFDSLSLLYCVFR